jgi:hypothetical protein
MRGGRVFLKTDGEFGTCRPLDPSLVQRSRLLRSLKVIPAHTAMPVDMKEREFRVWEAFCLRGRLPHDVLQGLLIVLQVCDHECCADACCAKSFLC